MGLWLALILCIALSAFFSATETAYSAANRVKLKTVEGPRKEKAQIALSLLEKYDSLITTVLIGNNLVNIVGTAIATLLFTTRILPGQEELATTVASVVMTVLVLFLGEVGPKTLAKQQPEKYAMAVSKVIRALVILMTPLDKLFSLWRKLLSKIVKPEPEESQIENELMTIIDEAQTEGNIEEDEGELIRSAIEFNDQDASDIMTPRVDVTAVEDTAGVEEAAALFRDTWFSRVPVYHEDLDHIVGILNDKDFYKRTHEGCTDIRQIMKEPVFAPATLSISNLLKQFRTSKTHLIVLLDEFGGTEGIVTMEDVLEELVGEIYDEHDEVSEDVVEQEDDHRRRQPAAGRADGENRPGKHLRRGHGRRLGRRDAGKGARGGGQLHPGQSPLHRPGDGRFPRNPGAGGNPAGGKTGGKAGGIRAGKE